MSPDQVAWIVAMIIALPGYSLAATAVADAGMFVTLFGIDERTVGWALAGGFFGTSFAPPTSWYVALIRYVLASMLSALIAAALSKHWGISEPLYTWCLSGLVSFCFYPLTKQIAKRGPEALAKALGFEPAKNEGSKS